MAVKVTTGSVMVDSCVIAGSVWRDIAVVVIAGNVIVDNCTTAGSV